MTANRMFRWPGPLLIARRSDLGIHASEVAAQHDTGGAWAPVVGPVGQPLTTCRLFEFDGALFGRLVGPIPMEPRTVRPRAVLERTAGEVRLVAVQLLPA